MAPQVFSMASQRVASVGCADRQTPGRLHYHDARHQGIRLSFHTVPIFVHLGTPLYVALPPPFSLYLYTSLLHAYCH